MQIQESVFVVTGGSSGLGAATVQMIAKNGGKVVIADINKVAGEALQSELGANALYIETDITSEESAKDCIDRAVTAFGSLQGLINCAGIGPAEKILGRNGLHRLSSFKKVIDVNLIGTFNMLRFAADQISKTAPEQNSERGVIINTASVAAFDGQIGQTAYAASKGAVVAMTLPLARELARAGMRVLTVAPGIFETPMLLGLPADVQESLGKTVPFPSRLGKPEEFAQLVRHIIENPYLNGEVIRLDGALRMAAK